MLTESAVVLDKPTVRRSLERHLLQATGIEPEAAGPQHWLYATAAFTRTLVLERWAVARRNKEKQGAKEACYFSMEFLIGRLLTDTLRSLGVHEVFSESLAEVGCNLEEVAEQEPDAGLGNGGLGRLAGEAPRITPDSFCGADILNQLVDSPDEYVMRRSVRLTLWAGILGAPRP